MTAEAAAPRARLIGGSVPRGGAQPTTGHAGRAVLAHAISALVAMVVVCFALTAPATRALALSESMSFYKNPVDYSMSVSSYRSGEGDVAYCCNKTLQHQNGLVYTRSEFATGRWGYVAYHGYPPTTVIEGTPLSIGRARSATQWAVWLLNGDDVASDPYFSGTSASVRAAAYALRDAALAYERSGVDGPENHHARLYYPPASGSLQVFLAVPSAGSVEVRKTSAEPSITQGNACYSLEGAVFELFSDEACTEPIGEATTNAEGVASFGSVGTGGYWVKEKSAPTGFTLDPEPHKVDATSPAGVVEISNEPQRYAAGLLVRKLDAETGEPIAQGNASLEGAEFTVRHYPALLATAEIDSAKSDATWVIATDASGEAWLDEAHKVGGDPLPLASDGSVAIPLGTLVIEETSAPHGYLPADAEPAVVTLAGGGQDTLLSLPEAAVVHEAVERGGISLCKVDRETGEATPLGMARLEGAVYSVANASASPVVVNGTAYAPGEVVTTLTTGRGGAAQTADDLLPVGTYVIREEQAPEGYLLDASWSKEVAIESQGFMADVFSAGTCPSDQVKRGDVNFSKVDGQAMARLAGVAFRLTLLEDAYGTRIGESHVIVTDENGMFDSSAAVSPHSSSTNASDAAVSEDGHVDSSRLAPDAGVWFSGRNTLSTTPDDALGALPYGTYLLEELRSAANEGHSLVRVTFTVRGHGRSLDLGTLDDNPMGIQTSLEAEGGSAVVRADGTVTLIDTVDYRGLTPGESYVMRGELHTRGVEGDDQGVLVGSDGEPVAAETSFVPSAAEGTVAVTFEFDATGLEGSTVVAFEECVEGDQVVARHEDISCEGQTVRFAGIATTATDASDGDHIVAPDAHATIVDTVSYQGLVPGQAYTLSGTLHVRGTDGSDKGPLKGADGNEVTATTEFTPDKPCGTVDVAFEIDASELEDTSLVAFERLSSQGELSATHEDISDEGQTVYVSRAPKEAPAPQAPQPASKVPHTGDPTNRAKPLFTFLAGLIALSGSVGAWMLDKLCVQHRTQAAHGRGRHVARALYDGPRARHAAAGPITLSSTLRPLS